MFQIYLQEKITLIKHIFYNHKGLFHGNEGKTFRSYLEKKHLHSQTWKGPKSPSHYEFLEPEA